jgi:hypothetical protein
MSKIAGLLGFEPREWRYQKPLPYRLATGQFSKRESKQFQLGKF